jgi:hypothetical protein
MFAIVYGLVAVALLLGFVRIVCELRTGKFFARGWKGRAYATREYNPVSYWSSMILEILVALLVTYVFIVNLLRMLSKH